MLIKFHSDYSYTESGFLFGWTSNMLAAPADGSPATPAPLPDGQCAWGGDEGQRTDGYCSAACMNEACNFDGAVRDATGWHHSKCFTTCLDTPEAKCYVAQLGDGVCDTECLNPGCNYGARAAPPAPAPAPDLALSRATAAAAASDCLP